VVFEDWIPTFLDLIGAPDATPENIDGISLAATLLGKTQPPRPFLYREFGGYGAQQSVRVGDWKAVRQNLRKGKINTELYNLAEDVGEKHNVADSHPEIVARLEKIMAKEHVPSADFPIKVID